MNGANIRSELTIRERQSICGQKGETYNDTNEQRFDATTDETTDTRRN